MFRVQCAVKYLDENARVHELIDPNTNHQRVSLIVGIFSREEVENIMKILISCTNKLEKLIWNGTSNGEFTVKSVYHFQKALKELSKSQPSISNDRSAMLLVLWKMNIHLANEIFLWRACLEGLSTNLNIFKIRIVDNPKCAICSV